jgi:hypothetical protein
MTSDLLGGRLDAFSRLEESAEFQAAASYPLWEFEAYRE